ncbi:MAG: LacI family DNA-binding transcriptional regulator [Trueperaceae bacterium]|nr:LacI family DNA-binding transcriptional regulator [Trueperaceae bacterium]
MATIKDVAKHAGVAPSTVSYALSGKRPISIAVKQRIERAIKELGFVPNAQAHNLRLGLSRTIAMVHPPYENMLEGTSIDFITAAAEALEETHTLSLFPYSKTADKLLDAFRQRRIDGLILMHIARHDERIEILKTSDYPFVLIGRTEHTEDLSLVDFDFENAAYLAIKHLIDLGHTRIGYLDLSVQEQAEDLGYAFYMKQGLERAQSDFKIDLIRQVAGRRNSESYQATQKLIRNEKNITAIVALLGATYLGILRALHDSKKRIPQDCSLICLGSAAAARWTIPSITTLDNQLAELGKVAAELLLERLAGSTEIKQILLPAQLVIRESTAARS